MGKYNYYAVRKGRNPGVYTTWHECEEQVAGFTGAVYKGFVEFEEAESFVGGTGSVRPASNTKTSDDTPITLEDGTAFVDGSYNADTKVYGYGGFVMYKGEPCFFSGSGNDPETASMRNVAGEISGAMEAVRIAEKLGLKSVTICYDYTGVENWAMGRWACNKRGTQEYSRFMKEAEARIGIRFRKVKAHTGIPGNEKADALAKKAAGVT